MISLYQIAKINSASYQKAFKADINWKTLYTSDDFKLSKGGYFGLSVINKQTKEIIIAHSGTNFNILDPLDLYNDLYNGYQIYKGLIPNQYESSAKLFIENIIDNFEDFEDYEVIITGHSLGAILAELSLLDFSYYENLSAMTFDSPGSKAILKQYSPYISSDNLKLQIYNSKPNFINMMSEQTVSHETIDIDYDNRDLLNKLISFIPSNKFTDTISSHYFKNILYSLKTKQENLEKSDQYYKEDTSNDFIGQNSQFYQDDQYI